jgi:hypothetical protein
MFSVSLVGLVVPQGVNIIAHAAVPTFLVFPRWSRLKKFLKTYF